MPATVTGLHYPSLRVLLPRTRLAYVNLKNLLGDAKRDRQARVSGYVAIWLPEELLILYLQRGEPVNACHNDGQGFQPIALGAAIDMVPAEPEYGEITFCEAEDEQLDQRLTGGEPGNACSVGVVERDLGQAEDVAIEGEERFERFDRDPDVGDACPAGRRIRHELRSMRSGGALTT